LSPGLELKKKKSVSVLCTNNEFIYAFYADYFLN